MVKQVTTITFQLLPRVVLRLICVKIPLRFPFVNFFFFFHASTSMHHLSSMQKAILINESTNLRWSNSKTLRSILRFLSLSLFFPQTNTRALYTRVEGITLLTGNPGYCNLPRLDSTCLSAVWYRVGHCCNWSRNAIALLIIEIINGTRYRAASQLQDRINRNILVNGAKEDFERLSFECYEHHDTRSSSSFVEF